MTWSDLGLAARLLRVAHATAAVFESACFTYIWFSAITRRRDRLLTASVATLTLEGFALVVGGGDCPLGPFQRRLGDPVPLFGLVLPPRAAKAAVPVWFLLTVAGMLAMAARPPEGAAAALDPGRR